MPRKGKHIYKCKNDGGGAFSSEYGMELFRDASEAWFESILPRVKESTGNKYRNLLMLHINPVFGDVPLDRLSRECLEKGCNEYLIHGGKSGTGLSPKTVSDIMTIVRSILRFAAQNGTQPLCDGMSVRIKRETKPLRVLSRAEQDRLCAYASSNLTPYNLGILICLFTGIRIGELCALRWEDISLEDQILSVRHTLQRVQSPSSDGAKSRIIVTPPKSSCSVRSIPIPADLAALLRDYQRSDIGYCLTNNELRYIDPRTMQNRFKQALMLSGVAEANFHALRHTFATRCVELGFDVKSLSEILGHSSVSITMNRYVHPSMEQKKAHMQRLCRLFTKNHSFGKAGTSRS